MPHDGSAGTGLPRPGTAEAGAADSGADPVLLVVSELVTNALVHTQGPVRLELLLRGDRVGVCVSDSSPRAPARPAIVDWASTGGKQVCSETAAPHREPASVGAEPGAKDGDRS